MKIKVKPIALNPEIKKPLAMQLADVLRSGVVHGAWKVGDVLPGIHELAAQCRVSEKVPRKALAILADEGWIDPKRGVGSVVIERGCVPHMNGRILIYVRETGCSYYFSRLLVVLESRLHSKGYGVSVIRVGECNEKYACLKLKKMLKEQWTFILLIGTNTEGCRVIAESGCPFVLVGDGRPLPKCSDSSLLAKIEIISRKALPEFMREFAHRNIRRVTQFKYAEGAFDVTDTFRCSEVRVDNINISRKPSPEKVSLASLCEMQRFIVKNKLPDLFLFTDDYLAQGALMALAIAGVRIPEDVAVVTHANKGLGPVWEKPLSRMEMDPQDHANKIADAVSEYFRTGVFPSGIELGSVWKKGDTF